MSMDARCGATQHGGRADLLIAQRTKQLAESIRRLYEQSGNDRGRGIVA